MQGRGDNNKSGSAGRGASNQSNQPADNVKQPKSNHGKKTGGQPSEKMHKTKSQTANRNRSLDSNRDE